MLPDHTPARVVGRRVAAAGRALADPADDPPALRHAGPRRHAARRGPRGRRRRPRRRCPRAASAACVEAAWAGEDFRAALAARRRLRRAAGAAGVARGRPPLEVVAPKLTGDGESRAGRLPARLPLRRPRRESRRWLQEIPDAVTKIAWSSWVEISPKSAEALGVEDGDFVAIETSAGRVEAQAYVRGGHPRRRGRDADRPGPHGRLVRVAGQRRPDRRRARRERARRAAGRRRRERRARLADREGDALVARARRGASPLLQFSDNQRGRELGEAISLVGARRGRAPAATAARRRGGRARRGATAAGTKTRSSACPSIRRRTRRRPALYRWGMSVDLDRCTGCSACVAACYVENNIPVVGEDEVRRVRPMSWLRIDRWIGDGDVGSRSPAASTPRRAGERLGEVDVRHAPMMCQHCGSAPCEPVCPVIATYHNEEGLNGDGVQPLHRHAVLRQQLLLQGPPLQLLGQPDHEAGPSRCGSC